MHKAHEMARKGTWMQHSQKIEKQKMANTKEKKKIMKKVKDKQGVILRSIKRSSFNIIKKPAVLQSINCHEKYPVTSRYERCTYNPFET